MQKNVDEAAQITEGEKNVDEAAQITEGLNLEAFMALAESLLERFVNECFDYLYNVVTRHHSSDFRLNAFQLLAENYELSPEDNIELACCLDSSDTLEIFGDEIQYYIQSELVMNTPAYDCYSVLDQLSSHTEGLCCMKTGRGGVGFFRVCFTLFGLADRTQVSPTPASG